MVYIFFFLFKVSVFFNMIFAKLLNIIMKYKTSIAIIQTV